MDGYVREVLIKRCVFGGRTWVCFTLQCRPVGSMLIDSDVFIEVLDLCAIGTQNSLLKAQLNSLSSLN